MISHSTLILEIKDNYFQFFRLNEIKFKNLLLTVCIFKFRFIYSFIKLFTKLINGSHSILIK